MTLCYVVVPGVFPVRALLIGRSNQHTGMTVGSNDDYGDGQYSDTTGPETVRVYRNLDKGHFIVTKGDDDEELAVFSFASGVRNNTDRETALLMAKEYAHGYVAAAKDCTGDK